MRARNELVQVARPTRRKRNHVVFPHKTGHSEHRRRSRDSVTHSELTDLCNWPIFKCRLRSLLRAANGTQKRPEEPTSAESTVRKSEHLRLGSSVACTALASAFLLMLPVTVWGQSSGGAIRGTITDSSGAVIQAAVVTIVQAGTGETR